MTLSVPITVWHQIDAEILTIVSFSDDIWRACYSLDKKQDAIPFLIILPESLVKSAGSRKCVSSQYLEDSYIFQKHQN